MGGTACRGASAGGGGGDSKGRVLECYTRSPDTIQTSKGRTEKRERRRNQVRGRDPLYCIGNSTKQVNNKECDCEPHTARG